MDDIELQLLLATLSGSLPSPTAAERTGNGSHQAACLQLIQEGSYGDALAAVLRSVWQQQSSAVAVVGGQGPESPSHWFGAFDTWLAHLVEQISTAASAGEGNMAASGPRSLLHELLLGAVAALLLFLQHNLTGPPAAEAVPECPFDMLDDSQLGMRTEASKSLRPGEESASPGDRCA
jgi:hypothetical protein